MALSRGSTRGQVRNHWVSSHLVGLNMVIRMVGHVICMAVLPLHATILPEKGLLLFLWPPLVAFSTHTQLWTSQGTSQLAPTAESRWIRWERLAMVGVDRKWWERPVDGLRESRRWVSGLSFKSSAGVRRHDQAHKLMASMRLTRLDSPSLWTSHSRSTGDTASCGFEFFLHHSLLAADLSWWTSTVSNYDLRISSGPLWKGV